MFRFLTFLSFVLLFSVSGGVPAVQSASPSEINALKDTLAKEHALDYLEDRRTLKKQTEKLEKQVKKDWKTNDRGRYTKRVDRDYLEKLEDAIKFGDLEVWNKIKTEYLAERNLALEKDKARATKDKAREERFSNNPWNITD